MTKIYQNTTVALAGIALLIQGCATSDMVSVDSVVPRYKVEKDRVEVVLGKEKTQASIETSDWSRVENLFNITGNDERSVFISKPDASPTQDAIVYTELKNGSSAIFRQATINRAKTSVTDPDSLNQTPAFTPDGKFLVFSSNRSGEGQDLWRKRADGAGGITQLTRSSAFDFSPSIGADGETIVFQSHRLNDLRASVWSVNINGGLLTQLGDGETPKVSPDGRQIAYVRRDTKTNETSIWLMQIDGSGQTELSTGAANDIDPSWHPSGRYIVFSSNQGKDESGRSNFNVWMMNVDGTERVQLTTNRSHDDGPVFDQTGRKVIFRSNRGGVWNIFGFESNLRTS
ncbi:MAG: hypothetical protein AAGI88_22140 [Pseudomonadota bacterium]